MFGSIDGSAVASWSIDLRDLLYQQPMVATA
jgi:hypothetical protein